MSVQKPNKTGFGHEKLDVYRAALKYVRWVYGIAKSLKAENRYARDQLLRASQSIPLNIAEGNGKSSIRDRRRYFEIARGSALECSAVQDVLAEGGRLSPTESSEAKALLIRIVSMLSKMSPPRRHVREERASYGVEGQNGTDYEYDYEYDYEEKGT